MLELFQLVQPSAGLWLWTRSLLGLDWAAVTLDSELSSARLACYWSTPCIRGSKFTKVELELNQLSLSCWYWQTLFLIGLAPPTQWCHTERVQTDRNTEQQYLINNSRPFLNTWNKQHWTTRTVRNVWMIFSGPGSTSALGQMLWTCDGLICVASIKKGKSWIVWIEHVLLFIRNPVFIAVSWSLIRCFKYWSASAIQRRALKGTEWFS